MIEVLEYVELERDFERQTKEKLGISITKARRIRDVIRKEILKK